QKVRVGYTSAALTKALTLSGASPHPRPYAHTPHLTATVLRNCLGETPNFFLNRALRYSTPENPNCRAISAMDRSVVVRSSFTLSIRKRRISSYGDRPNSFWNLRSSTVRDIATTFSTSSTPIPSQAWSRINLNAFAICLSWTAIRSVERRAQTPIGSMYLIDGSLLPPFMI